MSTSALTDRHGNALSRHRITVAVFGYDHDDGQRYDGSLEIGVNFDLRGCHVVAQGFYDTIDVGPQSLVVLPRDTARDRELTLSSP